MFTKFFLIIFLLCAMNLRFNKVLVSGRSYHMGSLRNGLLIKIDGPSAVKKVGEKLSLLCKVTQGEYPIDFEWRKNNESTPIRTGVFNTGKSSSLEIDSLSHADEGNYSCTASNGYDSDEKFFLLALQKSPKWLSKPGDIQVGPRDTFSIKCSADGHPAPNITWTKKIGSEWRDLFESSNVFSRKSATEITGQQLIKERDEGMYGCKASNGVNSSLWSEFMIKVGDRIWFFGQLTGAIQLNIIAPNSTNHSLIANQF